MKDITLKPCPFCGGEAELYDETECGGFGLYVQRFFVICEECHASGGEANDYVDKGKRLPEDYGEVICYTAYKNVCQLVYNPGHRLFNVSYDNIECAVNVTHWMPLPEAPKMKGGADK